MTNSHEELHKIVTQKEKDRTVTGIVTAQQAVPGDLKAQVTQLEKDRTVTNAVAANLKSQVTQLEKDRTVTGTVVATQPTAANLKAQVTQAAKDRTVTNPVAANLKSEVTQTAKDRTITGTATVTQAEKDRTVTGQVKVTDGINFLPTMDAITRKAYVQLCNGIRKAEVVIPEIDHITNRPGLLTISQMMGYDPDYDWRGVGGIHDYKTNKFSIATSRGAGKTSFIMEYEGDQTDVVLDLGVEGEEKLMIVGILTAADSETGVISLDFVDSIQVVWRHYLARFKIQPCTDMSIIGATTEPLTLNSTQGVGKIFVLINYRRVEIAD